MQELTHLFAMYGLLLVFAAVFLDEIGLPVPSLPVLVVAGAVSWGQHISILAIIGAALGGALLADIIWYWAARYFGQRILGILCRISFVSDPCVRQTENLFNKLGPWALVFARYVPAFTNIAVAMAAVLRLQFAYFLMFNLAGGFLYYGLAAILGSLFRRAVPDMLNTMTAFGLISIVAVIAALAFHLLLRWRKRLTFISKLWIDRIKVEEPVELLELGNPAVILDLGPADVPSRYGIIPRAVSQTWLYLPKALASSGTASSNLQRTNVSAERLAVSMIAPPTDGMRSP